MYTVYCHVFPNGKRYIGITKTETAKRWGNGLKYKSCPLVNRAIQKYGWNNVEHQILCKVESLADAETKEREYIAFYNTTDPEKGYNLLPGGNVATNPPTEEMRNKLGNGWRGKHRSEEEKAKISQGVKARFERPESNGHFGIKASSETKIKMSVSQKASWDNPKRREAASARMSKRMSDAQYKAKITENLAPYRRKKGEWNMPEDAKKKLSEHNTGKWRGANSPTAKPVDQYTVDGVFVKRWESAGEVQRAGVALGGNVSKCCHRAPHCKTAGGFVWRFANEPF